MAAQLIRVYFSAGLLGFEQHCGRRMVGAGSCDKPCFEEGHARGPVAAPCFEEGHARGPVAADGSSQAAVA